MCVLNKKKCKNKKIYVIITQTNIIVCSTICKKIKDILHVFKIITHQHKIIYVYLTSSLSLEVSQSYFKNYEIYEVYEVC
jgi:hypothetical protein